jgi:hypothetical protein
MKIQSYSSEMLKAIEDGKARNWPYVNQFGIPIPPPEVFAAASDYGDPYPFDKYMDKEWLKDD